MPARDLQDIRNYLRKKVAQLKEWLKPAPADPLVLTVVKSIGKAIALLLLIAVSPVLLLVMIFVFFAAL